MWLCPAACLPQQILKLLCVILRDSQNDGI